MNTTLATKQFKYQQWAQMVAEFKSSDVSIQEFCNQYGISKPSYYYRLRKLKEACLESTEVSESRFVPVSELMSCNNETIQTDSLPVVITYGGFKINVHDKTSISTLESVLKVMSNV